mgnify:CR=1 FL=1
MSQIMIEGMPLDEYIERKFQERMSWKTPEERTLDNYTVPKGCVLVLRTSQRVALETVSRPIQFIVKNNDLFGELDYVNPGTRENVSFDEFPTKVVSMYDNNFTWPEEFGASVTVENWDARPSCGGGLHGLKWGYGDENYLRSTCEDLVWQVVEVVESDLVDVQGTKVKFPKCTMILSTDDRQKAVSFLSKFAPAIPENVEALAKYNGTIPRRTYSQDLSQTSNPYEGTKCVEVPVGPFSNLLGSRIKGRKTHAPVLDIDYPARLVPSSTEGHYHLILDVEMSWRKYKKLLKVLGEVGVIEPGYARASIARRGSFIRVPWVRKQKTDRGSY